MSTSSSLFLMSAGPQNQRKNCCNFIKAKKSKAHPFISPEDEEDLAHIHTTYRLVLIIFGSVPVITYLIAIWVAAHPHLYDITHGRPNYNEMVMKYVKFNKTGNGQVWVYDQNMPKTLGYFWEPIRLFNTSRFTFGVDDFNFCNNRDQPLEYHWSTSIFRASQLYSSVQAGMRYGLLIMLLVMILHAYVISKTFFMEKKNFPSAFIGILYTSSEIFLYLSAFMLTEVHTIFDKKYIPFTTLYFALTMFSMIMKMILRTFMEPLGLSTIFRSIGIIILTISYYPLEEDIQDYIDHVYCDTFTTPKVCILQLLCFATIFLNNLYEVYQSKLYKIVVSTTYDEVITPNVIFSESSVVMKF